MVILLGILAGGGWWGWKSLINSSAEPTCVEQKLANNRLVPKQVVLNVYNGGAKAGSAQRVADALKKRGFNISKIANEPKGDKIDVVSIRGASETAPEMLLVAGQLNQKALLDRRRPHRPHRRPGHRRRLRLGEAQGPPLRHRRPERQRLPPRHPHPPTSPLRPEPELISRSPSGARSRRT